MSAKVSSGLGFVTLNRLSPKARAVLIAAGLVALQGGQAMAAGAGQNGTWTGASGGTWSNVNNWSGLVVAGGNQTGTGQADPNTGNTAIANLNTLTLGGSMTVHLDTSPAITTLNFGDMGNTYGWTLDNNGSSGNILTLQGNTYHGTINGGTSTMPQINVFNGSNNTISAKLAVGGNGFQNAIWGMTGFGTLNLTNATDTWGSGFVMSGGNTSSPLIVNLSLGAGSVGSIGSGSVNSSGGVSSGDDFFSIKQISVANQASTQFGILNISSGTVNCSGLNLGTSGSGTVLVAGNLNIGYAGLRSANPAGGGTDTMNISGGTVKLENGSSIVAGGFFQPTLNLIITNGSLSMYSDAGTTLGGPGAWKNIGAPETATLNTGGKLSIPALSASNQSGQGTGGSTIAFNGGILQITGSSAANFATLTSTNYFRANVSTNGGTIDTFGNSVTFNTNITHNTAGATIDGGMTLNDTGSTAGGLVLTGSNTYTGPTTITRGTLSLASTATITSSNAIKLASNGIFNVSALATPFTTLSTQPISGAGAIVGSVNAAAGSITAGVIGSGGAISISGPLALNGATMAFNLTGTSSGANGSIAANGGLSINAATTIDAIFSTLPLSSQTYTLFNYTGAALTAPQEANVTLSLAGSTAGYNAALFTLDYSTAGQVNLVFTPTSGASSNLTWAGTSGSHAWDTGTSNDWFKPSAGANAVFNAGDNVTFDDTSGVNTAVTLSTTVQPGSIADTAGSNNFVITGTGKISGSTNLTMSGSGTLTLGTANDFTGTTFLTNGKIIAVNTAGSATGATGVAISNGATLQIGDNTTTGAGIITGTIADNGSLVMNRPDTATLPTGIAGTGSLTQAGSGTTIISAQPGYSGATNITGGTLQSGVVNAIPFATALTLSGTGTWNLNNNGQTLNNVITGSTGTNINLGTGNLTLNTTSPDILQGQITGATGSSIYLAGATAVTLSNNVSAGTLALGNLNGDNVALNVSPGANLTLTTLNVGNSGNANGGSGVINQTGGLISAGQVNLAVTSSVTNGATATYNLSGGSLNVSTGLSTSQSQNSRAFINISGTGAINMLGNSTLLLGNFFGTPTTINQTGGSVGFATGSTGGFQINGEGNYTWNLSAGTLSVPKISWGGQALNNTFGVAHGTLNFNGGTFQTAGSSAAFFPADVIQGTGTYAFWTTTVMAGGAKIDTAGNTPTFINNMAHDASLGGSADGGLTLNDSAATPGVLTLNGSNTYTGPTTITRGTLALGPAGSINASPTIFVGSTGNFNVSGQSGYSPAATQVLSGVGSVTGLSSFTGGTITGGTNGSAGTLTFNTPLGLSGGISLFDLAPTSAGPNDLLVASGGLNVSGGSIIDAVFATAPTTTQTYVLFNYSSAALSTAAKGLLTLSSAGSASGVTTHNLSLSYVTGSTDQVLLTFTPGAGVAANLIWSSTSSGAWDNSSVNWHNPSVAGSGSNAQFFGGDNVTFDDTASVQTNIALNVAATPGSVTISSNTNNFSFTGIGGISGSTGLDKTGSSRLTLATNNSYTGATNLNGGTTIALNPSGFATGTTSTTIASGATFNIGNGSTAGAGNATGTITNNGTLNLNRPDSFTFPAAVSGNAFNQIGSGTTILTGQSTYSGDTNIQAGGLQLGVNNALPAGTNVNITNVPATSFALGSFSQTIGDLNGGANSTLSLGTGQLTIAGGDSMTFAGPVTGSGTSSLILSNDSGGGNLTLANNVSAGTISVAPADNDNETLNITGGKVSVTNLYVSNGAGKGGTGTINQTGGTVSAATVVLANTSSLPGNAVAAYALTGGTLNVSSGISMSVNNGTSSTLSVGPGTTLNMLGNSSIIMGNFFGQPASIVQTGGLVAFANGSTGGLQINGGSPATYGYTLGGGQLSIPRITFGGQAASSTFGGSIGAFLFDGGILQVTAAGQFFPSAVSVSGAHWVTTIAAGGAKVDTAGNNVVFTNALKTDSSVTNDGGLAKLGLGNLTLVGVNTYNGPTNVGAGTLTIATGAAYPSGSPLTVAGSAQFVLTNHSSNPTIVAVVSSLTNTGTIDITNNALDITTGSIATITAQAKAAYAGGSWSGTSATGVIGSSQAAADATHLTAVGVATGFTSFEGTTVAATDVLVKYTYYGDANLDGHVDGSDYSRIDSAVQTGSGLSGWYNGDFNYDGLINGSDYTLMDNAYNTQGATISSQIAVPTAQIATGSGGSAVPEPTTLGLLGLGATGLLGRRRRSGGR